MGPDPEPTVWRKVRRYTEPGQGRIYWRLVNGQVVFLTEYHRPLSWYVRALRAAGMVLTALEEPRPLEAFLAEQQELGAWMRDVAPMHLLIEASKLDVPKISHGEVVAGEVVDARWRPRTGPPSRPMHRRLAIGSLTTRAHTPTGQVSFSGSA